MAGISKDMSNNVGFSTGMGVLRGSQNKVDDQLGTLNFSKYGSSIDTGTKVETGNTRTREASVMAFINDSPEMNVLNQLFGIV